jgi:hypothetical protein
MCRASGARVFGFSKDLRAPWLSQSSNGAVHNADTTPQRVAILFRLSKTIFLAITPDASGSVPLDLSCRSQFRRAMRLAAISIYVLFIYVLFQADFRAGILIDSNDPVWGPVFSSLWFSLFSFKPW